MVESPWSYPPNHDSSATYMYDTDNKEFGQIQMFNWIISFYDLDCINAMLTDN